MRASSEEGTRHMLVTSAEASAQLSFVTGRTVVLGDVTKS